MADYGEIIQITRERGIEKKSMWSIRNLIFGSLVRDLRGYQHIQNDFQYAGVIVMINFES